MARTKQPCEGCARRKDCGGLCPARASFNRRLTTRAQRAFLLEEQRSLTYKVLELREELDKEQKKIIDLYYVEQLNQQEVAAKMSMSQTAVSRMLNEIHARIHELYHDSLHRFKALARLRRGEE
jgi:predicted DNA-binding protein YlxM (UPF0122 family)